MVCFSYINRCLGVFLILFPLVAQETEETLVRIGIMDLEINGGGKKFSEEAFDKLRKSVAEIGGYNIYTQKNMEKAFSDVGKRFPKYCREPGCVSAVGKVLNLDRMIYGYVDKSDKSVSICLTLVDVDSKRVIENISIEGGAGIGLSEVMYVSVCRLHGHIDSDLDTNIHTYYGKKVKNKKQLYISAASCIGAGLLWSVVNAFSMDENLIDAECIDYSNWTRARCGLGTGADLIPLFGRPSSLGNCYIAASDDAYGVFYNPAGLSWISGGEVSFGYQYRFGLNNFAASFVNKATREIGFGQGFLYNGDTEGLFSEVYFISGISYKFNELIPFLRPFSFGVSLKVLNKRTGNSNISESSISGNAVGGGVNFGFQIEFSRKIRYGILLRNAPSVIRWNNASTGKKYIEYEPTEFLMGGSFQANYATFLICEGHIPLYREQVWKFAGGIERTIFRVMRIRFGAEKSEGYKSQWKINCGMGLNILTEKFLGKYFILDVSYEYNQLNPFSNVLNFSFRFGF